MAIVKPIWEFRDKERLRAQRALYRLLDEAEADVANGDRGIGVKALRKQLGR